MAVCSLKKTGRTQSTPTLAPGTKRTQAQRHTDTRYPPQLLGNEVLHSSASVAELAGFPGGELVPAEERRQSLFLGASIIVRHHSLSSRILDSTQLPDLFTSSHPVPNQAHAAPAEPKASGGTKPRKKRGTVCEILRFSATKLRKKASKEPTGKARAETWSPWT